MEDSTPVIFDTGTSTTKFGLCDDEELPTHILPTVEKASGMYPVQMGIIGHFEEMTSLWKSFYKDTLKITPEEHPVFLTVAMDTPHMNKEKLLEIFFDELDVPSLYLQSQESLSLFSTGKVKGLVVNGGAGKTTIVPVFHSEVMPHSTIAFKIGGDYIDKFLFKLLKSNPSNATSLENTRILKEKLCYIAVDYDEEMSLSSGDSVKKSYKLPDGKEITLNEERFTAPELFFNPGLMDEIDQDLNKMIFSSLMKIPPDIREAFFKDILLSGGSCLLQGFGKRLERELSDLTPYNSAVGVIDKKENMIEMPWIGASLLCGLSSFDESWITKDMYYDHGPGIIRRVRF